MAAYEIIKDNIKLDAYKHRPEGFTLASGGTSEHYFDCRKVTMNPVLLKEIGLLFGNVLQTIRMTRDYKFNTVAGPTMGADPIVYSIALQNDYCPLIVLKEPKKHGTSGQIVGDVDYQNSVVLIEDVVTTGYTGLKAARVLRQAGITVRHAICLLDREEGGVEAFEDDDIELWSLYRKSQFI